MSTPPDIEVLLTTPRLCVISKPAGMLSVPGKGPERADCAAARVAARFPRATGPLVVHRLDMETSGLMVFGLDPGAQRALSMQFEARTTEKVYIALVATVPRKAMDDDPLSRDAGTIDIPMRADLENRPRQVVDHTQGRASVTAFRVLSRGADETRLELVPHTGRTHQLRVHCAVGLGRPIVGDSLYGDVEAVGRGRLMLHATRLAFRDPETRAPVVVDSPAPF